MPQVREEELQKKSQEVSEGGAIVKPKRKKTPPRTKVDDALQYKAEHGGAIVKPKRKKTPPRTKVDDALQYKAEHGGAIKARKTKTSRRKFYDPIHRHLHTHLTGRGGRLDPPYVRRKMHEIMRNYHPSVFQSYMKGSYHSLPMDFAEHPGARIKPTPRDPRPTVVDTGGSMPSLTHRENGYLVSADTTFYHQTQIV